MTVLIEQEETVKCDSCGMEVPEHTAAVTPEGGDTVCSDCGRHCDDCGNWYANDGNHPFDDDYCSVCAEYYGMCDRCEVIVHNEAMFNVSDDYWCEYCTDHYSVWCSECDARHEGDACESDLLESYNYRPRAMFHDSRPQPYDYPMPSTPYLGLELEVEVPGHVNDYAEPFTGHDLLYLKSDGSLSNGFEIVTHPMTHDYFIHNFPWNEIERLRRSGGRSWDPGTCGIHVHISRAAFDGMSHLWLFAHLIHDNQDFVTRVAGRYSDRWAAFSPEHRRNIKEYVKPSGNASRYADRYNAVNFCNRDTLEVRVFRGSLRPERIMSAVDFVDAAFWYTKGLKSRDVIHNKGLNPSRFIEWVHDKGPKYAGLNVILDEISARRPNDTNNE